LPNLSDVLTLRRYVFDLRSSRSVREFNGFVVAVIPELSDVEATVLFATVL